MRFWFPAPPGRYVAGRRSHFDCSAAPLGRSFTAVKSARHSGAGGRGGQEDMGAFSLAENPFVVLPVSPRSTRAQIDDAFAGRVAARPAAEAVYLAARQTLLDPEGRLAAEVAWLIDIEPTEAAPLMSAMGGTDKAALLAALKTQPPLTRANVAADACGRFKSTEFIGPLALAHSRLDVEEITNLINFDHEESGTPPVDSVAVDGALAVLARRHADAAIEAMIAAGEGESMRAALSEAPPSAASRFLDELLAQYGRGVEMRMAPADASQPASPPAVSPATDPEAAPLFAPQKPARSSRVASPRTALLWIGVLAVAIIAMAAAAFEFGPRLISTMTGRGAFPGQTSANAGAPDPSDTAVIPPGMAPNGVAESPPPPHPTKILSQNQLRFCVFTKVRLTSLNPSFRTFGYIAKFTDALSDYNARCAHVKYMSNDFKVVTLQLRHEQPRLQAEADGLVKSWSQ